MLLVKHSENSDVWALPGGHLEKGEGLVECMKRELLEELGIEPQIGGLLYINIYEHPERGEILEFFFEITNGADYADLSNLSGSHDHEIARKVWASPDDNFNLLPSQIWLDFKSSKILADGLRYIKD